MSDNQAAEAAKLALPGAVQAAGAVLDYVFGLVRAAGASEAEARAELAPLYARLQKRADSVEAQAIFDPDAPRRPSGPAGGRTFENDPVPDPTPTAPADKP